MIDDKYLFTFVYKLSHNQSAPEHAARKKASERLIGFCTAIYRIGCGTKNELKFGANFPHVGSRLFPIATSCDER